MPKRILLREIVRTILLEAPLTPEKEILKQALLKKYKSFVTDLKDEAGDHKVNAALNAGLSDGSIDDDKISMSLTNIPVTKLRPTQNEIDISKSLNFPLQKDASQLKDFLTGVGVEIVGPIVTLNGKWIVDGHHRWSQVYAFNADATMKCMNMIFPGMHPLEGLKGVQTAIAASMGTIPTKSVEGTNLLTASEDKVKGIISYMIRSKMQTEGGKAIKWLKKYDKIDKMSPEAAAGYIWNQVEVMQTKAIPAPNAPERGYMPQVDEPSDDVLKDLEKGKVNWNEPY